MDQEEKDCPINHSQLVCFDPIQAKDLNSIEIRRKWPRKICPECQTIIYASFEHYVAGDW